MISHPDPTLVGELVVVSLPRDPVTIQAELGFYNRSVRDPADRIGSEVFSHVIGDPATYPSRGDKDRILSRRGGLQFGPQGVGQGRGGTTLQLAIGDTIGAGGALELDYEISLQATSGGVLGGLTVGSSVENSVTVTSGRETTYTGTVGTIPNGQGGHQWGIFTYVHQDAQGRQFEVIDYWVE